MRITELEMILRLFVALLIGGLLGLERTIMKKPAGIKTQAVACIVSTMVTMVAVYGFENGDPTRIISNILTGIGFLAAGVIISVSTRSGKSIVGLTTASAVWGSACLGIPIGLGHFSLAFFTFVFIEVALRAEWALLKLHVLKHNDPQITSAKSQSMDKDDFADNVDAQDE